MFDRKEITVVEISVYHNLMVVAGKSNIVYFYDYEYCRVVYKLELEEGMEATAFGFINGFNVLMMATNLNRMHLFQFQSE